MVARRICLRSVPSWMGCVWVVGGGGGDGGWDWVLVLVIEVVMVLEHSGKWSATSSYCFVVGSINNTNTLTNISGLIHSS